ncbi:MAG TPA: DNA alkylation repair protein, partial [bacterium]|nr:DNA alkylation repair protein [bacterium]
MDATDICAAINARLEALPVRGVPEVRGVRREFSRQLKGAPAEIVLKVAQRFIDDPPFRWGRFMGYELIRDHPGAFAQLDRKLLERLGQSLDNWADVDCFSTYLSGRAWQRGQVPDAAIHRWARSEDRWWRRTAVVSTIPLNSKAHGGSGDPARTLEVCTLVVDDRDDMVVKAVSWALRELAKRDPAAVARFVTEH